MKLKFYRIIIFSLLVTVGFSIVKAQTSPKNSPYIEGETLTYEARISKVIPLGSAAVLTFNVGKAPDGKNYLIKAEAKSKGTLISLFNFSFLQKIESTVDSEKFTILKSVKHDEQRKRIRDSEAIFDYTEKKVTYVETDPNDAARPPRRIASNIENETYDIASGVYILRYLPLTVGKNFVLNISDSGLVYQVPVRVTARETQNTIFGKVPCFRIEPEVFGPGRMIENKGSMIIWISDDSRRLPVRGVINTNLGKIDVKIRSVVIKK